MVDAIVSNPGGASTAQRVATPEKSNQVKIAAPEPEAQEQDDGARAVIPNSIDGEPRASATKESLAVGEAVVGAAISAASEIEDLLNAAAAVAEDAVDEKLAPAAREDAQQAFTQITQDIDETAKAASFEGFNLVDPGARDITVLATSAGADIEVQAENISSAGLGIDKLSLGSAALAAHAVAEAKGALSHTTSALARFGATATRISELGTAEIQAVLPANERLPGIDAALSTEAAETTAAAARDALSQTGLGIANGNPYALGAVAT